MNDVLSDDVSDLCGHCGQFGADKVAAPTQWPGELAPGTLYVHAECEETECIRAHAQLTQEQRDQVINERIKT